ncbi:MAG: 4Fe-4S dicluster domain-containing protein [Candidatus Lokiarchaeota archaeon]|nr:4Fe-4S dicluster domain-containing protein [Candidatus Lokiarchaeota archaeon]
MRVLGIDKNKCTNCKLCTKECPVMLYHLDENEQTAFSDEFNACIECGHCMSSCPSEAIRFEAEESFKTFDNIREPSKLIDYETLMNVLRARRSIRQYKNGKEIPDSEIDAVLEAMRYAPNASNYQNWRYIVINNKKMKDLLVFKTIKMFKLLKKGFKIKWLVKPFVSKFVREQLNDPSTEDRVNKIIESYEKGNDPIFFNAPCVIILHSPNYGKMCGNDAGLAFMHGMLAAQARGLGTCWIGSVQELVFRDKAIRKKLGIPKGNRPWGVMTLGYPSIKYKEVPSRKPLNVIRI